jgi:hypothetical protein
MIGRRSARRKRNPAARAVRTPKFRPRVVANRKLYSRKREDRRQKRNEQTPPPRDNDDFYRAVVSFKERWAIMGAKLAVLELRYVIAALDRVRLNLKGSSTEKAVERLIELAKDTLRIVEKESK